MAALRSRCGHYFFFFA